MKYLALFVVYLVLSAATASAQDASIAPVASSEVHAATIDGEAVGWRILGPDDFAAVNSAAETWIWKDGVLHCTGQPVSVLRTTKEFTNVEIMVEWMHEKPAGNSGVFLWAAPESIEKLAAAGKPGLPLRDAGILELRVNHTALSCLAVCVSRF